VVQVLLPRVGVEQADPQPAHGRADLLGQRTRQRRRDVRLAFAALSETLKPRRLAGILAAAPSVAIAGLAIGAAAKGPADQAKRHTR
jgi:hypothetical protein